MSKSTLARRLVTCANRTAQALAIFLPIILGLGFIVALVEDWPLLSSDWWHFAMVTASTVGYGDLSPQTWLGRAIGDFLLIPVGLIGVGVIVGRVAATVIETRDAWKHEEQEEVKEGVASAKRDAALSRRDAAATRALVEQLAAGAGDAKRGGEKAESPWRSRELPVPPPLPENSDRRLRYQPRGPVEVYVEDDVTFVADTLYSGFSAGGDAGASPPACAPADSSGYSSSPSASESSDHSSSFSASASDGGSSGSSGGGGGD